MARPKGAAANGKAKSRQSATRRSSMRLAAIQAEITNRPKKRSRWALSLDGACDDMDGDDEAAAPTEWTGQKPSPKILAQVAITRPITERSTRAASRAQVTATSIAASPHNPVSQRESSESSFSPALRGQSSGYETPGTSALATPAEGASQLGWIGPAGALAARPKVDAVARARALRESKYSLAPKRKWGDDEDDEDDGFYDESLDATMARKLQEAEYARLDASSSPVASEEVSYAPRAVSKRLRAGEAESGGPSGLASTTVASVTRGVETRASGASVARAAKDVARRSLAAQATTPRGSSAVDDSGSALTDFQTDDSAFQTEFEPDTGASEAETAAAESDNVNVPGNAPPHVSHQPNVAGRGARRPVRGRRRDFATRALSDRQQLERSHPGLKDLWTDLAATPVIPTVRAPQPASITRQLKPFQLEGLHWMIEQEKTKWKGGLLGDEMGMGKTIQAVSLIMSDYPSKAPTLVVVPPVAMLQWQNEIRDYTNGLLKVLLYHGAAVKKLTPKQLKAYDILITSYSTLECMHRKQQRGWIRKDKDDESGFVLVQEDSSLHAIKYHRVILDEAHNIKTRSSGAAKACFALEADFKWCLSGTPLQNRIGELFSLLRFLEVRPFACYMCKVCDCSQLHWSLDTKTRQCNACKHRGFDHLSLSNLELLNPINQFGNEGLGAEAFGKLRLLLDRIMLRRVKSEHLSSMELPGKDVVIRNEFFGEVERDFASSIMTNTTRQFDTYVAQGVALNNYANIFGLLMQMRQVADHPDMILRKNSEGGQNVLVCCICDDPAEDAIRSQCRHDFCRACVRSYMKSFAERGQDPGCPRCHIPLSIDLEQEEREQDTVAVQKSSIINRIRMENWTSSTKIEMLIMELARMRSAQRTKKCIIFSQFTSMLQLVEWRLRRAGFNTVMLDGTMTPAQRQGSINHFMKDADVTVFLVSLKAGGVALNLTEASEVFIVDPWWNPAAEWQSADRCHRIGQLRPCTIKRFVIEDSVESRMVLLQEKKSNMIRGTINADDSAMQNLTVEDMQFLFKGT